MASFHHRIKSGTKGQALRHANYILRIGLAGKDDLIASGAGNMPDWAQSDPRQFWRMADQHERRNGATYREHVIALPAELTSEQLLEAAMAHVNDLVGANKPYQFAIHCPTGAIGEVPNPHMHLMYSDRSLDGIQRSPAQTFARYNLNHPERGGARKDSGGRTPMELRDDVIAKRKRIAETQNQVLAKYGHTARVDHRSLKERGITRAPERRYAPAKIGRMSGAEKHAVRDARAAAYFAASDRWDN